ncbi:MAG: hypothetical protein WC860_00775 [Candidatus Margulisiibacteriota bacterium]|jgi:hypothetical protein
MQKELLLKNYYNVKSTIDLLVYSINKFPHENEICNPLKPEIAEYFDSLSFRFEKSVEMLLSLFRTIELYLFALNSKTLRELLLKMEKLELISSSEDLFEARGLRNIITHTYEENDIFEIYSKILKYGKVIIRDFDRIKSFINEL